MKRSHLVIVITAMLLPACASTHKVTPLQYEGVCMHPAIQGGMPFPLPPDASFPQGLLELTDSDTGGRMSFTGAACMFREHREQE